MVAISATTCYLGQVDPYKNETIKCRWEYPAEQVGMLPNPRNSHPANVGLILILETDPFVCAQSHRAAKLFRPVSYPEHVPDFWYRESHR